MQIDFSRKLSQLDGSDFPEFETLNKVATFALTITYPGDESLTPLKKFERGHLAMKIHAATAPVEFTSEDAADLKALIGRAFGPLIVAQAFDIIENHLLKTEEA